MKTVTDIECMIFIETDISVIGTRNKPLFVPLINFNVTNSQCYRKDLHSSRKAYLL